MKDTKYRIASICPGGLSNNLKEYLARPVDLAKNDGVTVRDCIAINLLKPFQESSLSFCCTYLGWSSNKVGKEKLNQVMLSLGNLSATNGTEKVSSEGFTRDVPGGTIQIMGVYPLLDLDEEIRSNEYLQVSFINNEFATELLSWSYEKLLAGALATDEFGIMIAILAESDKLAGKRS